MEPIYVEPLPLVVATLVLYTALIVWFSRRPADREPTTRSPDATGGAARSRRADAGPSRGAAVDKKITREAKGKEVARPFARERDVPVYPGNVQTFTRQTAGPRSRSRSRSRSVAAPAAPLPLKTAPLLPTISGSSISLSTATPTVTPGNATPGPSHPRRSERTSARSTTTRVRDEAIPGALPPSTAGPSTASPSTAGTSTQLARAFTNLTLNTATSTAPSTARRGRTTVESDDEYPFVPSTPVSSASRSRPRSAMVFRIPGTPPRSPQLRDAAPIVGHAPGGIAIRLLDRTVSDVLTRWCQADEVADELLDEPPHLTQDQAALQEGDIYYHCSTTQYQFWILVRVKGKRTFMWEPVTCGYERADGRYLIITKICDRERHDILNGP
ncbi:hypothetical protein K466DRAFT_597590 [Polyporus arcularius HHB13444]|uniref:Uncharacterized protein n=1 Tax=Polyporus arcularius HHB13444 TaxID=1314778 RepID=A0A5C3PK41_9APHY|nr:hypothetical protein K466DRAFT_597590 [Polyporus arcularius HHB13444]